LAGKPYADCLPGAHLSARLRGYGYTVYTKGNDAHMEAVPPEDHTPFSQTGWPVESPEWYGHALDIMPQNIPAGCPTLAQLGAQMFNDKTANVAGARVIKYMNWEPNGQGLACYHDAWEPTHRRTPSTDRGHIHVSIRSDATHSDEMAGYDPVKRWRDNMTATPLTAGQTCNAVWHEDGPVAIANKYFPWRADSPAHEPAGTNDWISGASAIIEAAQRANLAADRGQAAVLALAALRNDLAAMEARLMAAIAAVSGPAAAEYMMAGTLTPKVSP
jgi:hypothetical protein